MFRGDMFGRHFGCSVAGRYADGFADSCLAHVVSFKRQPLYMFFFLQNDMDHLYTYI